MAGKIYPNSVKGKTYYYYKESVRVKIDVRDGGKIKGSGKSRVKTTTIYLGAADEIVAWKKQVKGPISVKHRAFGMTAAAYQVANEFGLVDVLKENIHGQRFGVERWVYFLTTIINRIDCATSKNKMADWAKKTVLPDILGVDAKKLSSKKFWYVTDDVTSETDLKKRLLSTPEGDIFCGLDDKIFQKMETDLFSRVRSLMPSAVNALVYDTTNFFSFFETPDRSELAQTGHNKESRHNLRQVGLAMALDKSTGLPFFHRPYRGNSHDSRTLYAVMSDLLSTISQQFSGIDDLVFVLDKGNNSQENFDLLKKRLDWIGSLVPTHHPDLLAVPLTDYSITYGTMKAFTVQRTIMGHACSIIVTFNPKLALKQQHSIDKGIEKLKRQLQEKFASYKKKPSKMTSGLTSVYKENRRHKFVNVSVTPDGLEFTRNGDH